MANAVRYVSLMDGGVAAGSYGPAPDVENFFAGTLDDASGGWSAVFHWGLLGDQMICDWWCSLPADSSNFSAVQIFVKSPNGSGGFNYISAGDPIRKDQFQPHGALQLYVASFGTQFNNVPTPVQTWTIIACSANAAGMWNVDSSNNPIGPSVDLATLEPASLPLRPPTQPASFTAQIVEYGFDDANQQPVAHIKVTVPAFVSTANVIRVYQYDGTSAPLDPQAWGGSVCNVAPAASGPSILEWFTEQSFTATRPLMFRVRASSATYNTGPSDSGPADQSTTIAQVGAPPQVTSPYVACLTQNRGGAWYGALVCTYTPPVDPSYFTTRVYAIQCDASYAPLPGEKWNFVGSGVSGFDQSRIGGDGQWFPLAGDGYVKFKFQSTARAKDPSTGDYYENTANPPTVNLHISPSSGLNASMLDLSTLDSTDMQIASGKLGIKNVDLSKAINYNGTEFYLLGGRLTVNGIDLSKAIASTLTTELAVAGGKFGVAAVSAAKITAGTLAAGVVYAGTVAAGQIAAGTLAAGVIYSGNIVASQISSGYLNANVIYSGAVNVSQLQAGTANFSGVVTFRYSNFGPYVAINSGSVSISNGSSAVLTLDGSGITVNLGTGFNTIVGQNITTQLITASRFTASGSNCYHDAVNAADYRVNGITAINSSGAFVGAGVSCLYNGIGGSNFNVYQFGWYYGVSGPATFPTADGRTVTVRGGIITSIA